MFPLLLLISLCFGSSCSFPLEDCQTRSKDILFILDCRADDTKLIECIHTSVNYLSKVRGQETISYSIMAFTANGLIETDNITEIQGSNFSCGQSFPMDQVFNASEVWFTSRKRPLVTIILISNEESINLNYLEQLVQKQNKDKKVNRFLILPYNESLVVMSSISFLYLYSPSKVLDVADIMSKMCERKCTRHPVMFTTGSSMTSYYHLSNVFNMSHDESVQYCAKQTNSYLISLESSEEITFIFNVLHGTFSSKEMSKMRLNLGLQQNLHWYSQNPFVFLKKSHALVNGKCYFTNVSILEQSVDSLVNSLFSDDCSKVVNPSLVICECHEAISNLNVTRDLINAVSGNKNIKRLRYLFDLLKFVSKSQNHFASIQTLDCAYNSSNSNEYGKHYICNKSLNNQFDDSKEEQKFISTTQKIDPLHFQVQRFDVSDCQFNSEVKQTKNFESLEEFSLNGDFESLCTNQTIEPKSRISKNIFKFNTIPCGSFKCDSPTTVFQCEHQKKPNVRIYKCIKMLNTRTSSFCEDNSNLQNCENFNCPNGLIKCPNSFCIYNSAVNDGIRDCPLGEDEIQLTDYLGIAKITFSLKELCIAMHTVPLVDKFRRFYCDLPCPHYHVCISTIGQILIFVNIFNVSKSIYNVTNDVRRRKTDLNIARKLAFVALTDFMCWFPVGILGFLSLNGHIFDREVYAWIAVFVMPINSALNPIIYTIPAIYQKYISNVQRRKSSTGSVFELSSFSKVSEWLSRN
ncbi:G-protein coupled receptor GRL101 [Biomphalaria glabrata]